MHADALFTELCEQSGTIFRDVTAALCACFRESSARSEAAGLKQGR